MPNNGTTELGVQKLTFSIIHLPVFTF